MNTAIVADRVCLAVSGDTLRKYHSGPRDVVLTWTKKVRLPEEIYNLRQKMLGFTKMIKGEARRLGASIESASVHQSTSGIELHAKSSKLSLDMTEDIEEAGFTEFM